VEGKKANKQGTNRVPFRTRIRKIMYQTPTIQLGLAWNTLSAKCNTTLQTRKI